MDQNTYKQTVSFFAEILKEITDPFKQDVISSAMSHLKAWSDGLVGNVLFKDEYFMRYLIPEFEKFLKNQAPDECKTTHSSGERTPAPQDSSQTDS